MKNLIIHENFTEKREEIIQLISDFDHVGQIVGKDDRNKIKFIQRNGFNYNVKAFKIPNVVNQFVYNLLRKSKAKRSYQFACRLLSYGIGTPQPIAYLETNILLFLRKSYYVSEHLHYDWTFRELRDNLNLPDHENILRQFTRFTHQLHSTGVEFLDHSPGNTLIKKLNAGQYAFYLVDLNRMAFPGKMSLKKCVLNFIRLTDKYELIEIMSDEYAKLVEVPKEEILQIMWPAAKRFHKKYNKKKQLLQRFKY